MFFLGGSPQTPGLKGATQNCADYNQEDSKGVKNKMLFHNICKLYLESHETAIRNVKHSSRYTGKVMEREEGTGSKGGTIGRSHYGRQR